MFPRFRLSALLLAVILLLPAPSLAMTTAEEKELGQEFIRYVREHLRLVDDPVITEYVNRVGRKILAAAGPQPLEYHFYVVQEDVYNAFAGPGGHVFIHSGLLTAMKNEDDLAGILAHEISHVTCRHISEKISRDSKLQLATLAGMVAGIFLGGGAAGTALVAGSMAAGTSASLSYSRRDEMQADELGLTYLAKAGYSAQGLMDILDEIRKKRWYGPDEIPDYLSSHPAVEDRLGYIGTWITSHPGVPEKPASLDPYEFDKVKCRTLALYTRSELAAELLSRAAEKHPENPAIQYGQGLVLLREGRRTQAVEHLLRAARSRPFDPDVLAELGRAYLEAGKVDEALKTLGAATAARPGNALTLFNLGRALLAADRPGEAAIALEKSLELDPDHLATLQVLGQAQGQEGRMAEAHFHLGLFHKKKRDFANARFHLAKALELAGEDTGLKDRIKAALEDLPSRWQTGENQRPSLF
ncbi:MAG: M48 family metalloprotease [Proteobacteria bacterium]|nr:M48 family metalloprotease [Pseudomonadota bacterium]